MRKLRILKAKALLYLNFRLSVYKENEKKFSYLGRASYSTYPLHAFISPKLAPRGRVIATIVGLGYANVYCNQPAKAGKMVFPSRKKHA